MRLVLLGDPVEHSRSPAIWAAALKGAGIAGTYRARRVDAAGMAEAVAQLRAGALHGANVTMPHKALAASLADRADPEVTRAGAANTLALEAGAVVAHNTDVAALRDLWISGRMPGAAAVLVLGSGGAAAAAAVACEGRRLSVSARDPAAAAALAGRTGALADVVPWGQPVEGAILVNATPLGMAGEELPSGLLRRASGLVDLPYGEAPTPAVVSAGQLGIPCVDGIDHLVAQAVHSFTIWTGSAAPVAAMSRAARAV